MRFSSRGGCEGGSTVSNIEQIKHKMKVINAPYKSKMEELYSGTISPIFDQLGDLVEIQNGTYA
jgi:hypothetical protein